jgi:hypothetical protein
MTDPDGAEPLDDDEPPPPPPPRSRRRLGVTVGLLVLLGLLIAFVPRHSSVQSTSLPPGRWGETIRCLERLNTDRVTVARTGAVPSAHTSEVDITSIFPHRLLAQMRDAGAPAAARAVATGHRLGVNVTGYRTAGPIVWGYAENGTPPHVSANAGDRTLISFCATHPHR